VSKDPRTREQVQRCIAATDNKIDQLVYELYWLTEEEIKIVDGGSEILIYLTKNFKVPGR